MHALVVETIIASDDQPAYEARFAEVATFRAQQPGFHCALRVDAGAGRSRNLNVWETQAAQRAFQPVLAAYRERMGLSPPAPLTVLGQGEVVRDTRPAGTSPGYARLIEATCAPGPREAGQAQIAEWLAVYAQQPGFRGVVSVDAGDERRLSLYRWDSAAAFATAQPTVLAAAERLVHPLLAAPTRVLGSGVVVYDSLRTRA